MPATRPRAERGTLRYIDIFLESFEKGDRDSEAAFGRHVHWGYWDDPARADGSTEDFVRAADRMCTEIFAAGRIADGDRVLDVGCGFGGTLERLSHTRATGRLVGVNNDIRQLRRARQERRPAPGARLDFVVADGVELPVAGGSFDVVLSIESISHLSDRERFFREARRVLAPGGRLVVVDFVPADWTRPLVQGWHLAAGKLFERFYGAMDVRCCRRDYARLAERTGFVPLPEHDATRASLPSYPYTRRLMERFGRPRLETMLNSWINLNMEWSSRGGLLHYLILPFRAA